MNHSVGVSPGAARKPRTGGNCFRECLSLFIPFIHELCCAFQQSHHGVFSTQQLTLENDQQSDLVGSFLRRTFLRNGTEDLRVESPMQSLISLCVTVDADTSKNSSRVWYLFPKAVSKQSEVKKLYMSGHFRNQVVFCALFDHSMGGFGIIPSQTAPGRL